MFTAPHVVLSETQFHRSPQGDHPHVGGRIPLSEFLYSPDQFSGACELLYASPDGILRLFTCISGLPGASSMSTAEEKTLLYTPCPLFTSPQPDSWNARASSFLAGQCVGSWILCDRHGLMSAWCFPVVHPLLPLLYQRIHHSEFSDNAFLCHQGSE